MPDAAWISIVVTVAIFVLTHIVVTVWWAAKVNTVLEVVEKKIETLIIELKATRDNSYRKEEAIRDVTLNDKEHEAMWKKIDLLLEEKGK